MHFRALISSSLTSQRSDHQQHRVGERLSLLHWYQSFNVPALSSEISHFFIWTRISALGQVFWVTEHIRWLSWPQSSRSDLFSLDHQLTWQLAYPDQRLNKLPQPRTPAPSAASTLLQILFLPVVSGASISVCEEYFDHREAGLAPLAEHGECCRNLHANFYWKLVSSVWFLPENS